MAETTVASKSTVPSSMGQVGITIKYELLNYMRSRRFIILLVIALLISGLLSAIVGYYRPESFLSDELTFFSQWWGSFVGFVIVLSAIFFGGDAISGEFQNKTGYFIVPNPIRRSSIYVGKWLAAFIASSIILGVFVGITVANEIFYFGASVPYQFGESAIFAWFYLAAALGFTFFFSALFKSSAMSILITVILLLFVFTLIQNLIAGLVQIEPWFILTYGSDIISNVLSSTYPAHASTVPIGPRRTLTIYNSTIPEGLAIMGVYFLVTAILGLYIFEKREFN